MEDILRNKLSKWTDAKDKTVHELNEIADILERKHAEHIDNKHHNAKKSLIADVVGLGGVLLAPFSERLSLLTTGAAAGISLHTVWSNYSSRRRTASEVKNANSNVNQTLSEYFSKTEEIQDLLDGIIEIYQTITPNDVIDDIRSGSDELEEKPLPNSSASISSNVTANKINMAGRVAIESSKVVQGMRTARDVTEVVDRTRNAGQIAIESSKVVQCMRTARDVAEVADKTRSAGQIASESSKVVQGMRTTRDVADVVDKTKNAGQIAIESSKVVQGMRTARDVAEVVDKTKNAGHVVIESSKVVQGMRTALDVAEVVDKTRNAGQIATESSKVVHGMRTARDVTEVVDRTRNVGQIAIESSKVVQSMRTARDVAEVADKTRSAGQIASESSKVVQGACTAQDVAEVVAKTRNAGQVAVESSKVVQDITGAVKETSRFSEIATKAASVSKVSLVLSAINIPFDVYNIVTTYNEKETPCAEAQKLRTKAEEIESCVKEITSAIEEFEEWYLTTCENYQNTHDEGVHETLKFCHERLKLECSF